MAKKNKTLRIVLVITGIIIVIAVIAVTTYLATSEESKDPTSEASSTEITTPSVPAFPGAEGFGANALGGRGGKVIEVTNLKNKGSGSLREAIETKGKRIVVFRVSGTINLSSDLKIEEPYITIAGQTAPGDGITLSGQPLKLSDTHDVIIRHIRSRLGKDNCPDNDDAIDVNDSQNVIFDHVSASWSIDETFSIRGDETKNVTIQWSIISESLNDSCHEKGDHGYGSILGGKMKDKNGVTVHHTLYAHHDSRNPRFSGQDDKAPGPIIDFRNNVVYNWGSRPAYPGNDEFPYVNYVANYIKPGPSSYKNVDKAIVATWAGTSIYLSDNYHTKGTTDWDLISGGATRSNTPFSAPTITTTPAQDAYNKVLESAGAILPKRDAVDTRVINDVKNGTGKIIDSQNDVGGWPKLNSTTPPADSDHDGMPDDWEEKYALDPNNAADSSGDKDKDGYTNVEEYLNNTEPAPPKPTCTPNCSGKECGSDDCGGSCGTCKDDETCSSEGKCEAKQQPTPTPTPTPSKSSADLNDDSKVDMNDYAIFVEDYLAYRRQNKLNERSDMNEDGKMNMADYSVFVSEYLKTRRSL